MRVGVFGATGQVGGVMRTLLAERAFPVDGDPVLRLGPLGGHPAAVAGRRGRRRGHRHGRLLRARPGPVLQRQDGLAGHGAAGRGGRRHRDRQLLGLADGPRRAAGRGRGQPRGRAPPGQGHHRQPELHHHGRHAGAGAAAPRAGLVRLQVATYQAVSGSGGVGVAELDAQVKAVVDRAAGLAFDGRAVELPAPSMYVKPIAFNVLPLAGSIVGGRLGGDRRGAEAPQRVAQDPAHPGPAGGRHVRPGARLHRSLAWPSTRSSPTTSARSEATAILAAAPGVELMDVPTPLDAAGRDPSLRRPDPSRPVRPGRQGLVLFVATTTCARARRSTRCRSPNWSAVELVAAGGRRLSSIATGSDGWPSSVPG